MTEEQLLEALKAIAHPSRLKILQTLAKGETNVGEIEEATGIAQPTLSQQLAILRKAELVDTRRQAKLVYYSLDDATMAKVCHALSPLSPDRGAPAASESGRKAASGVANFARLHI
ncbi:ArsR/SmtB family transcription factor [Aurantiacibacter odishensis]|uniref:ArsR/SmtB family transcription factor n=1 Tax=Aurantiacibacter odishensis TaxID=1155476 RepID=UPI000E7110DF|nr:metalloregulator ArsR/SmtB family transcription factor [Aurantiacibacter odishensis]